MTDFKTLNASLLPHTEKIIRSIDANARRSSEELWFADPGKGNDKKRDSASINVKTGRWNARASNKSGGDVISLVAYLEGTSQGDAARIAAEIAGVELPRRPGRSYNRDMPSGANAGNKSSEHRHEAGAPGSVPPNAKREGDKTSKLWARGQKFEDSIGAAYLQSRDIDPAGVLDDELRFIAELDYFHGTTPDGKPRKIGTYPAILAPIRNGLTRELSGVLRIWLDPEGTGKAHIVDAESGGALTPKKVTGPLERGGIWFGCPGETLLMCEGLEDALSLRMATGLPAVATSGWQQMGKTALPPIVKRLIVVPDDNSDPDDPTKDNVGERGLEQAARIYGELGIEVLVVRLQTGKDSNDVLRVEGAEALAFSVEHPRPFEPTEPGAPNEPPIPDLDEAELDLDADSVGPGELTEEDSGELTEDSIALDFERKNEGKFLFNATRSQWLSWIGHIWEPDETAIVLDAIRSHIRTYGEADFQKLYKAKAVEGYCRTARTFARTLRDFDADPMLLGTPGGTVELRTGVIRPARPKDCISKCTAVAPAAGVPSRWLEFLSEATRNDAELMRFLQQIAGYALTGNISEHCLFFIYGDGGTGKSTYVNTLTKLLGSYATTAPMDTFVASSYDRHPTDLAMLAGSRLVTANETETGRNWAAARIKSLSGGDPITARFMRQDFFTYEPSFKLVFVGNHAPNLQVVDEAIRRRFHIVPFDKKPKDKDPHLAEKLAAEGPQILQWAIAGCLDWQKNGLLVPKRVKEATGAYFSEQDLFTQWVTEKVTKLNDMKSWTPKEAVLASWNAYRAAAGEKAESSRDLTQRMKRAGFQEARSPDHANRQRVWLSIELVYTDETQSSKTGSWKAHKAA